MKSSRSIIMLPGFGSLCLKNILNECSIILNIQFLIALTSKYLPLSTSSNKCVFNHWNIEHAMKILIILLTKFQCLVFHRYSQIFSRWSLWTEHYFVSQQKFKSGTLCDETLFFWIDFFCEFSMWCKEIRVMIWTIPLYFWIAFNILGLTLLGIDWD